MAKKQFKAESKRLLDIMINSIYTHKEIFLRELISNASDAVDKLCFMSLTDPEVGMGRGDFFIRIDADKEGRSLKISDNGVGMTRDELESNLGVIARSGSLKFKQELSDQEKEGNDVEIIGQFGVGFYSAFMVSDKVTVRSRAYGSEEAWQWESSGADGYSITPCEKDAPGTEVIMAVKADTEDENYSDFIDEYTLVSLVKKYSDYIRYPILMEREKSRPVETEIDGEKKTDYVKYTEVETLNSMVPIWQRVRGEVSGEDYSAFYKEKFHDFEEPLLYTHVDAEGVVSYKALLFIPGKAAYDFYTKEFQKGLQLYSGGVMIMEKCADLLPEHFRFVQGVVDSPDLSLNISRELLQHDRQLKTIAKNIERKIKNELLKLLGSEREKYESFWKAFGMQLKYGAVAEYGAHRDSLQDLLMFYSSEGEGLTTLAEYVSRMKEDQAGIYYATGESVKMISQLPQAEKLKQKGYEILYLTDDVDEFAMQVLRVYKEKEFKAIGGGDLGLESEEEKKELEQKQEQSKDLLGFVKEALGDKIKEAKLSGNLVSHPVCLSAGGFMSFEMEKYMSAFQPDSAAKADRILELNPAHEVFAKLQNMYGEDKEKAKKYVEVLYGQALLIAGLPLEDPAAYSGLVLSMI
ncbi:MAG: molecular chaperone HtpG [Oscillospiraceae bacterium]|nr:molecular chaperone HtpG [Oscillospiraceae bacterium]